MGGGGQAQQIDPLYTHYPQLISWQRCTMGNYNFRWLPNHHSLHRYMSLRNIDHICIRDECRSLIRKTLIGQGSNWQNLGQMQASTPLGYRGWKSMHIFFIRFYDAWDVRTRKVVNPHFFPLTYRHRPFNSACGTQD